MGVIEFSPSLAPLIPLRARRERVILPPGRILASADPVTVIATVGSSVAVCLWDFGARMGGVAHFLLPATNGWERARRCGTRAIPALIERMIALGARRERLTAKIFGGARIIPSSDCAHGPMNVQTALETLNHERVRIVAADLEGDRARKVLFDVVDGRAWIKRV
jgi:chemotaxis protein CheD